MITVPLATRASLPNFIAGTPDKGWHDRLDPSECLQNWNDHVLILSRLFDAHWNAGETVLQEGTSIRYPLHGTNR